jgi:hypothetical protein
VCVCVCVCVCVYFCVLIYVSCVHVRVCLSWMFTLMAILGAQVRGTVHDQYMAFIHACEVPSFLYG